MEYQNNLINNEKNNKNKFLKIDINNINQLKHIFPFIQLNKINENIKKYNNEKEKLIKSI